MNREEEWAVMKPQKSCCLSKLNIFYCTALTFLLKGKHNCSVWSHCLSLAVLAWTLDRISNPAGSWEKILGQQVTRKPSLSISQLKCAEGEVGLAQSGGPNELSSHSSCSQQGERKHQAKRISPNPCWFFFFCGLKRNKNRAKCPNRPPNEHYAISPWLSGVLGLFVSLKRLLVQRWNPNDTGPAK